MFLSHYKRCTVPHVEKELEVLSDSFHKVTKFAGQMDYNARCKNVMPNGDGGEGCRAEYILMYSS